MIKSESICSRVVSYFHILPPLKKDNAEYAMTKNVPDYNVRSVTAAVSGI